MRRLFVGLVLAASSLVPRDLAAQSGMVFAREGWEAFRFVTYVGGDSTQAKTDEAGMLVLTDTAITFYRCRSGVQCVDRHPKKEPPFKDPALVTIPLSAITAFETSSRSRGPTMGDKFLLGRLAGSVGEEFVKVVYDTAASAEAPLFKTRIAQSGLIDAKVRVRLKKLGIELPAGTP